MFRFRTWTHGRRGWLRPWILSIVAKAPKNGAEIMDDIERMSWGNWRPSPGSVYPLLEEMSTEGLIKKNDDGRYEITEKGKSEMDWPFGMPFQQRPNSIDQMLGEINGYIQYFEDLSRTDKSKIAPYTSRMKEIADRLSRAGQ